MTNDISERAERGAIPVEFYQWLYTIERDVLVWDLTPNEISALITALARSNPDV
jgi:hypothetical protein